MNLSTKLILVGLIFIPPLIWMLFGMVKDPRRGLPLIGLMLFFASVAPPTIVNDRVYEFWILPVQIYRTEAVAAIGLLIFFGMIPHLPRSQWWRIPACSILLLIAGMYAGLLRTKHESVADGLKTIVFAIFTLVPPALMLCVSVRDQEGAHKALRALVYGSMIWVGAAMVQYFVNRRFAFVQTGIDAPYRFSGVSASPQYAATILSMCGASALYLVLNSAKNYQRLFWFGALGISLPLLFATGSRTGAAMLVLACLPAAVGRLGVSAIFLPPAAAVTWFIANSLSSSRSFQIDIDRFLSTDNTRAGVWSGLIERGMSNPMFGVGVEEAEFSENSYLYGFASYGAGMLIILIFFGLAIMFMGTRLLLAWRKLPPSNARLALFAAAMLGAYLFGSMLEGYAIGRVHNMHFILLTVAAIGAAVLRQAKEQQSLDYWLADDEAAYDEHEDDHGAAVFTDEPVSPTTPVAPGRVSPA